MTKSKPKKKTSQTKTPQRLGAMGVNKS